MGYPYRIETLSVGVHGSLKRHRQSSRGLDSVNGSLAQRCSKTTRSSALMMDPAEQCMVPRNPKKQSPEIYVSMP